MITDDNKLNYGIVAFIQNSVAGALAGNVPLAKIIASDGTNLAHELRSGQPIPRSLALDFSPFLDRLDLSHFMHDNLTLDDVLKSLADPVGDIKSIFSGKDPGAIFGRISAFFSGQPNLHQVTMSLGSFLEGQLAIALTLVTTFKNLVNPAVPRLVTDACLEYFFGKDGFVTVDEIQVTPPMQFSGNPLQLADLKGALSDKNAERYLRDIISVTVEAAGDIQYKLRDRYPRALAQLPQSHLDTAKRWFKGYAAMAEAGVTTTVEETLLGIGTFQGNRLIAASAAAYAGTAARKATQHVFLSELEN